MSAEWEPEALHLLSRIISTAAAGSDRDAILRVLCKELAIFFDVPQVSFAIWDSEYDKLTVIAEYVEGDRTSVLGLVVPIMDGGITKHFLDSMTPLVLEDVEKDPRLLLYHNLSEVFREAVSLLLVPVVVRGAASCLLTLNPYKRRDFRPEEIRLAQAVAATAAQVLEIALLYQDAQGELSERRALESTLSQNNAYLGALHETALGLMNRLELVELLETIVARAAALVGTEHGFIFLVDAGSTPPRLELKVASGDLKSLVGTTVAPGEGMAGIVWQRGEPMVIDDYSVWGNRSTKFEHVEFKNLVAIPLRSGSQVIGVLGAGRVSISHRFTANEVRLLTNFAQLASIALDNARLYAAVQMDLTERMRAEEARHFREGFEKLLAEISARFINLALDDFDRSVVDALRRVGEFMGADRSYMFLFSEGDTTFRDAYEWRAEGTSERSAQEKAVGAASLPLAIKQLRAFKPVVLSRLSDLPDEAAEERAQMETLGIRSLAVVPLGHARRLIGVLGITFSRTEHEWEVTQIRLLKGLANVLVDALEHMRNERILLASEERYRMLFAAAQRQTQALSLLDEVRTALARELTLPDIFHTVVEAIAATFGYSRIAIYLRDNNMLLLQYASGSEPPLERAPVDESPLGAVVSSGKSLLLSASVPQTDAWPLPGAAPSQLFIPLRVEGAVVGLLAITAGSLAELTEEDMRLMEALGEHINIAIGRARLYAAVRQSELKYRTVVDNIKEVVFQADPSGSWLYLNPSWTEITGFSIEETLQTNFMAYAHPDDLEEAVAAYQQLLQGQAPYIRTELRFLTATGSYRWMDAYARPLWNEHGSITGFTGMLEDITERKRKAQLEKDHNTVLEMVARNESLSDVFNQLIRTVERSSGDAIGSILLLHEGRLYHSAAPSLPHEYSAAINGSEIGPTEGSCGTAAYLGSAVIVSDIATDPRWDYYKTLALPHGLRACWSVPILSANNQVLGTFAIYSRTAREPTSSELELLEMVQHVAAIALEQRQLNDLLAHQAQHDALTGLPNRPFFNERLNQAIQDAKRSGLRVGVLFIDLDRFKQINDTLGHAIGDALLQQVADRLNRCIRQSDILARMGGDEFTLVLTHIKDSRDAIRVAQNLLDSLRSAPFEVEGHELYVSASIGISIFPDDGLDAITLQRNADSAMYGSKNRGRDNLQCFDPQMAVDALAQLELEIQLRRSLERNELVLYYQPIVTLDGEVVALEALVRWIHPVLGVVSPGAFIPLAEETGLIVPIGTWILGEACRQASKWVSAGLGPFGVTVNVSAVQFAQANFVRVVTRALEMSGLPPHLLTLELTEGVLMHDSGEMSRHLAHLRQLGVQFAIDDFGTGYSSLSYLQQLPIDTLKIDQSFMSRVGNEQPGDENSDAIIRAITTLGHSLGIGVLAEGLENPSQLELLKQLGCDWAQGYYFAKPMTALEIESLLHSNGHLPHATATGE